MKNFKVFLLSSLILIFGTFQNSAAQPSRIKSNNDNQKAESGYIKIGDIKGESTDAKHKDWINLLSFSESLDGNPTSAHPAAFMKIEGVEGESICCKGWYALSVFVFEPNEIASNARTKSETAHGDVVVVKSMDKSSSKLAETLKNDQPIPQVKIVKYNDSKNRQEYYVVNMKNVLISSYQTGGSSGDVVPVDQLSLNFSKIEVEYVKQDKAGQETHETLYESNQTPKRR